jgi:hypothetical protein
MKDNTIKTFANWRAAALVFMAAVAVLCLAADADSTALFLGVKAIGIAIAVSAVLLFRHWDKRGLMDDLKRIAEE